MTEITFVRRAVERSLGGNVGAHRRRTHGSCNTFDSDVGNDIHGLNGGSDVVSSNFLVASRFDV